MTQSWRTDKRSSTARGYDRQWRNLRDRYLQAHPLCVMCQAEGKTGLATVVDHKVPHRGDRRLLMGWGNLQSLCKWHHDSDKQRTEKSGRVIGCSADGVPLDPRHHWNQA